MRYEKSALEAYVFSLKGDQYTSKHVLREPEVLKSYRAGNIDESLYLAGNKANIPDKTVMELANIFGWDIDFVFDIRKGDSFAVLFEERFIDGKRLGTGNILAASFTNRGKTYKAVRYTNSQGQTDYYTPDGLSMRKAFLRTPLDIFRISSGFNLRRKHPIHKKIRAHRGVDYAAPTGTPVYSSGDGRVLEAGYTKANGNYVFIQHGQTYITKYIHLHRKKVRTGQSVKQRQIIGTVGATGYATGPHLHYEFLVNGVHRNPRTVSLPKANPISANERSRFNKMAIVLLDQLTESQHASQLAIN
jgi:murein DD-endopeptidase MepM/ murein hydrolase activator NlpD